MNDEIIRRWNAKVPKDSVVYVIGDFVWGRGKDGEKAWRQIRPQLNGRIRLIPGNHDHCWERCADLFEWVDKLPTVKVKDSDAPDGTQSIVLSHYAMRVWDRSHHGSWNLYGHSHGTLCEMIGDMALDVGVDMWDYTPVSYLEIKAVLARKMISATKLGLQRRLLTR